ncbi:3-oxoacyl-[acyl-carrier protein] reductase [Sedimentibacter acidaminivorans]|uniref:3-oxoacyl-[acyl-carrier protein] reductase n=1 Tax=Sedimentibacter acidaminivorans TaxID=913099 RepID=A0ABS4G9Z6_9FIRM|nr:3-oxoacyl-ACP reductase FabG [Sedimentibacter acidaminivorans]MBP1924508.1 3-oxoacyl-[acyl-carrier protein] reductase [Sedimentibacter acidaminivorans]
MNRLKDKVAIVTGGARGIGRAVCEVFSDEGAKVIAVDIVSVLYSKEWVEGYKANLCSNDDLTKLVEYVKEKYGKIDILVNNAGITKDSLIEKMSEEMWDDVININLKAVFNITKLIAPVMKMNGKGSIINISSVVGEYGNVGQSNYAATKAGIIGLTKSWAKEFSRKGEDIRVNSVAPGYTNTEMMATVPEKVLNDIKEKTMLKRLGDPKEIANAILFLASEESSYITGQLLSVNGGLRL